MKRGKPIKNPCRFCGKATDATGWCGSRDHDAGNPFGGINCVHIPKPEKDTNEKENDQ